APLVRPVFADVEGPVSSIRTRDLGLAVIELGGGRRVAADRIDHRVGLSALLGKGDIADRARPLCRVHAADDASFAKASALVKAAYTIGGPQRRTPAIHARIGA
ncbi:MAG: thymidine phosphorylase, partial [Aestuariivirga sp.]